MWHGVPTNVLISSQPPATTGMYDRERRCVPHTIGVRSHMSRAMPADQYPVRYSDDNDALGASDKGEQLPLVPCRCSTSQPTLPDRMASAESLIIELTASYRNRVDGQAGSRPHLKFLQLFLGNERWANAVPDRTSLLKDARVLGLTEAGWIEGSRISNNSPETR